MSKRFAHSAIIIMAILFFSTSRAKAAEETPAKAEKAAAGKADTTAAVAKPTTPGEAKPADGAAAANPDLPPVPSRTRKPLAINVHPSLVAAVADAGGRKTLAIQYRWQVHDKASIEVRLIPESHDRSTVVVPVYFFGEHFKGKTEERIYKCLDSAGDRGSTFSFTKDKMVYQVIGERNSLGHPAVHVLCYNEGGEPADRPDCVFLQLDAWAVSDRLLSLDLPREVFAKPGILFVWFFRDDKLLWEEKADWPGNEGRK